MVVILSPGASGPCTESTHSSSLHRYMGGFTRPKDLRASNWYRGGAYLTKRRIYEPPHPSAYTPRTVFILEGRYPVAHGHGRVDYYPRFTNMCLESDLPALVGMANSPSAGRHFMEPMDNARWPWAKQRRIKRVRWWEIGEDPDKLRCDALDGANTIAEAPPLGEPMRHSKPRVMPTELLSLSSGSKDAPQIRALHTSAAARRPNDDRSSFQRPRQDIPGSSWSRPPKPSQDSDDNVVPSYYVERKKQWDDISERKEEEGGLMYELNAGILSEGLAAKTRVRDEKIPVEVRLPDGTITHPSGFEPPTPETDFHPVAAKVPMEDDPLAATSKQTWDGRDFVETGAPISVSPEAEAEWIQRKIATGKGDGPVAGVRDINAERPVGTSRSTTSPADRSKITTSAWDSPSRFQSPDDPDNIVPPFYIERKRQRNSISERKEEEGGLMAELNAGILSDELAAHTRGREEKIPVEVVLEDGTVLHPSGFVPPTAETEFHPVAAKPGDVPKQYWSEVLSKKSSDSRGLHTSAVARARTLSSIPTALQTVMELQGLTLDPDAPEKEEYQSDPVVERRQRYLPTLPVEPYWRPLLTVTCSTRPLAAAIERLAKGGPRGMPFIAMIEDGDRKDFASLNTRMRNLQLNRVQYITSDLAKLLGGARGGLVGVRFAADQRGRGIGGDGLADPIPKDKRMLKIGVGEWYPWAEEVKERFAEDAKQGGYEDCIEVFGVDEWGKRVDGKKWEGERTVKQTGARSAQDLIDITEAEVEVDERDVD